jgi:molybdopterin converting factor small subunit
MAIVAIPTPLRKYTGGARQAEGQGDTLRAVFDDLEQRHPGLKFRLIDEQGRLREHFKLFVNQRMAPTLDTPVAPGDAVQIILAISGGGPESSRSESSL